MNDEKYKFAWGCLFLGIGVIFCIITTSCHPNMPGVDVKFWAGDSEKGGISRSQDQQTITCSDPKFDQYACLSYVDIKKIFNLMLQCKDWSNIPVNRIKASEFVKRNTEVIHHVFSKEKRVEPVQY